MLLLPLRRLNCLQRGLHQNSSSRHSSRLTDFLLAIIQLGAIIINLNSSINIKKLFWFCAKEEGGTQI